MQKRKNEPDETQRIEGHEGVSGTGKAKETGPTLKHAWKSCEIESGDNPKLFVTDDDTKPYWEEVAGQERALLLSSGPPPHGTFRRVTVTEETNDKEWMHRNMDLADLGKSFNKSFDKLLGAAVLFAAGMILMGALIWILSWS